MANNVIPFLSENNNGILKSKYMDRINKKISMSMTSANIKKSGKTLEYLVCVVRNKCGNTREFTGCFLDPSNTAN